MISHSRSRRRAIMNKAIMSHNAGKKESSNGIFAKKVRLGGN